jgi:DNA-binding MarR family transcriptional regulator
MPATESELLRELERLTAMRLQLESERASVDAVEPGEAAAEEPRLPDDMTSDAAEIEPEPLVHAQEPIGVIEPAVAIDAAPAEPDGLENDAPDPPAAEPAEPERPLPNEPPRTSARRVDSGQAAGIGQPRPDPAEIHRAITALYEPGDVVELRVPKAGRDHTISGYFDDHEKLANAVLKADGKGPGVYLTLNPAKPALLARSCNRAKLRAEQTTTDADVLCRRRLLVDVDATRPAGVSSTDAEHEAALDLTRVIRDSLDGDGWPDPIVGDSGNGGHLIYRLDLPNDNASKTLLERCLKALAAQFDNDRVKIDQTVFNASRISKAYGTVARKGDHMPDRPHRLARLLDVPEERRAVPRELLEALASTVPDSSASRPLTNAPRHEGFDIDRWISEHGLAVKAGPLPHEGGRKWVLECPFDPAHKADAAIFEGADGKPGFHCFHNGCAGKDWHALRELLEPGYQQRQRDRSTGNLGPPAADPTSRAMPELTSGLALYDRPTSDLHGLLIVEGTGLELLYPGVELFAARQKLGKSWLALQIAISVAGGPDIEGLRSNQTGGVLYGALEESERRTIDRLRKLAGKGQWLDNLKFFYSLLPLMGGGEEQLQTLVRTQRPRLLVLDTLTAVVRASKSNTDVFRAQYDEVTRLRKLCEEHALTCLLLHHTRKEAGGDAVTAVAGTGGITAAVDAVWRLRRTPEGFCELEVTGREIRETSLAMKLETENPFGWRVLGEARAESLSNTRRDILDLLKDEPNQTPAQIARDLNKNAVTVRVTLKRLVSEGHVVKERGKYRTVSILSVSPNETVETERV